MGENGIEHLIRKYYQGSITSEEEHELLSWIHLNPENKEIFVTTLRMLGASDPRFIGREKQAWQKIEREIYLREQQPTVSISKAWRFSMSYGVAAALLVLVMGVVVYLSLNRSSDLLLTQGMLTISHPGEVDTFHTQLPDGSVVWLNKSSYLTYSQNYGREDRVVELVGEGFFEVAKDSTRPFSVLTQNVRTTALGTSFNIRAFPEQGEVQIALTSGKVQVSMAAQSSDKLGSVSLIPGEEITYSMNDQNYKKELFDPEERLAWKSGVLYFKAANISKVAEMIEKWYGVDIQIRDETKLQSKITATFQNESLERVLEVVNSISVDYQCNWDGKRVLIQAK